MTGINPTPAPRLTGVAEHDFTAMAQWLSDFYNSVIANNEALESPITGEIRMWSTDTAPTGWLNCDGSAQDATADTALQPLFDVIGNTFGGSNNTDYLLPDFRGRAPVGIGTGDAATPTDFTIARKDGDEVHRLTVAELASHTHTVPSVTTVGTAIKPGVSTGSGTTTGSTGGDTAHNNLQPSLGINFIIKT